MGAILRNTMFHYNIKEMNHTIEHYNNGTTKQMVNETNEETQRYLNQIIFELPLHNFPVYFIVVYMVCIFIYVLLSVIYYRVFHPWKIIMGKDNSIDHVQEGESKDNAHQDDDESPLDEEGEEGEEEEEEGVEEEDEEEEEEISHL